MHKEQGRTVETPVEARAGFLDRPVLVVLGASAWSLVLRRLSASSMLGFFRLRAPDASRLSVPGSTMTFGVGRQRGL